MTTPCDTDGRIAVGRYNKYSRTLSQTPWIIDGSRKTESSIEELVCTKIQTLFRADGKNGLDIMKSRLDVRENRLDVRKNRLDVRICWMSERLGWMSEGVRPTALEG